MTDDFAPALRAAPGPGGFPLTRFSVVHAAGSTDSAARHHAWDALIRSYWKPVYKYIRIRWHADVEETQDLTQAFFARAMEADFFRRFDPGRARFRTYLRVCVNRFVANERKAAGRRKRGGDVVVLPFDFADAEGELRHTVPADGTDPDAFFRQEAIRHLLSRAVAALEEHCTAAGRTTHYELFRRCDLLAPERDERPSYLQLAGDLGLTIGQVTNQLASARRDFRRIVLDLLREVSGSEAEFRAEAFELLGVDPVDVAV